MQEKTRIFFKKIILVFGMIFISFGALIPFLFGKYLTLETSTQTIIIFITGLYLINQRSD